MKIEINTKYEFGQKIKTSPESEDLDGVILKTIIEVDANKELKTHYRVYIINNDYCDDFSEKLLDKFNK